MTSLRQALRAPRAARARDRPAGLPAGRLCALVTGLLACLGLVPEPAAADVVYLRNGEVFEDVVAELDDDRLRLELPFGALELPREAVLRVERREAGLRGYLAGRARLDATRAEDAAEWLALARRARADGLDHGYRESLRVAADLDPGLDGLASEMHRIDWTRDAETGRWRPRPRPLPEARPEARPEHRSSAARSPDGVPPSPPRPPPPEAGSRALERSAESSDREIERALARTLETLAAAELARARRAAGPPPVIVPAPLPFMPVLAVAVGGWVSDRVLPPDAGARRAPARVPGSLLGAGGRQPGSLLPPSAGRSGGRR